MLSSFRKLSNNFFTKILLLLIVASFMLWGVSDMVGQPKRADVAQVGDLSISANEYYMQLQKLRANMGEFFSPELVKKLGLLDLSLQELIAKKLYSLEADFLHVNISDDMIKQIIKQDSAFQNENGAFDGAIFERRLKQMRISEKSLTKEMKAVAAEELLQKTIATQANFPEKYYDMLFEVEFEQRKMILFNITDAEIADISAPTEDEVKGYYDANITRYNAPEYRDFEYIMLDKAAINENIEISEEQLRQEYLKRQKQLMTPEKREIWQLLYDDKDKAEQAYGLLRSGKKMEAVARKIIPVNKDNIALGVLAKHQFNFNAPDVFVMANGGFTSPVKTDFGWHVFQVRSIKSAFVPAFEDLREQLKDDLSQAQKNKTLQELMEKMEDGLAADMPLLQLAVNLKLKLQQSGKIDASGKRSDNTQEFAVDAFQPLLSAAFALKKSEISEIIALKNGDYVLLGLKEITEPRPRVLQEVHGLVTADLQKEKRSQARTLLGEKISSELRQFIAEVSSSQESSVSKTPNIEQMLDILRKNNVKKPTIITISRDGVLASNEEASNKKASNKKDLIKQGETSPKTSAPEISEKLREELFAAQNAMQPLDYVMQGEQMLGGVYVMAIKPDKKEDFTKYAELKLRIQKQYEQEIMVQYLNALQRKYPIIRDVKVIESVNQQF